MQTGTGLQRANQKFKEACEALREAERRNAPKEELEKLRTNKEFASNQLLLHEQNW